MIIKEPKINQQINSIFLLMESIIFFIISVVIKTFLIILIHFNHIHNRIILSNACDLPCYKTLSIIIYFLL